MATRTEQEIMKNWKYDGPPLVSVVCITYNHELYIRDAIEGFLMQETDFPFEIIIHDDASTDRTAEIVKEYATQYPKIIKTILQSENQYSKGKRVLSIAWAQAQGEYIALCEGDDYWIDSRKLSTQIDTMTKHTKCDISFHSCYVDDYKRNRMRKIQPPLQKDTLLLPAREAFVGFAAAAPTGSLILRKKVLLSLPDWYFSLAPVGDVYLKIFGALGGGALYINRIMSVYRTNVNGSWTRSYTNNSDSISEKFLKTLDLLNEGLKYSYQKELSHLRSIHFFNRSVEALSKKRYNDFVDYISASWKYKKNISISQIILYNLKNFPVFLFFLLKTKQFAENVLAVLCK